MSNLLRVMSLRYSAVAYFIQNAKKLDFLNTVVSVAGTAIKCIVRRQEIVCSVSFHCFEVFINLSTY